MLKVLLREQSKLRTEIQKLNKIIFENKSENLMKNRKPDLFMIKKIINDIQQ